MDRLALVLHLIWGAALTGIFLVAVLTLGFYSWPAILGAVAVGAVLAVPASLLTARHIKRQDPDWDHRRNRPVDPTSR